MSQLQLWRKDPPVLDPDTGEILKGGMWPHQRNWWELPSFVKALVAGYGAGKSFIGAKRAISLAFANAPAPHLWVSPTYGIARKTVIPLIEQLLLGKSTLPGWTGLRYDYNKQEHQFTIVHGQRRATIWVVSGDTPSSLKGPTVGSATIDEPFIQEEAVFEQVVARIRDTRAKYKELDLTGTPEQLNWGYEICEGDKKGAYDVGIIHAHTKENIVLGEDYYKRMEQGYDPKAAQAYVGGQFINLSKGQVYYGFSPLHSIVKVPDPGHELEVGMDFNVNPMACCVFWRNGIHMHVIEEIELPNADTQYMCSVLREKYGSRVKNVYPDASCRARHTNAPGGRSDMHFLVDAGFQVFCKTENPAVRDRENAVNAKLSAQGGRSPTLTFDPSCKRFKKYLLNYTHENKNKDAYKAMSHLLDALGYPVAYLYPVVKPYIAVTKIQGS